MKLTTKGRYAVMAMADLARHGSTAQTVPASGASPSGVEGALVRGEGGKARPISLADIASRQEISLSYLEQLFARLRRANLVTSVRGPGGGYLLSHRADETRISDIIIAVDEPLQATRCKPGSASGCLSDHSRCLTHDLWDELSHQIHVFLSSVSLGDVIEGRLRQKPNFIDNLPPTTPASQSEAGTSEGPSPELPELRTNTG